MSANESLGLWGVPIAVLASAVRGGTPFLFVSVGECLTEKSGKINLGLEGVLLMGAMSAYAISYRTGSPWLGVAAAGCAGMLLGSIHAWLSQRPKVNDIAVGIAMIVLGSGRSFRASALPTGAAIPPSVRPSRSARCFFSVPPWRSPCSGFLNRRAGGSISARSATSPMRRAPWASPW
jgi:ABC-type uncharacterized transport system permease subunit